METGSHHFALASYDNNGDLMEVSQVSVNTLVPATLSAFLKQLQKLSGDLELPLEAALPGPIPHLDYRVGSDLNGAYVLYYLDDEIVCASLYLRGQDVECETELTQVFRFLLLDTEDHDEPTEEEIEEVLAFPAFDFDSISDRPVAFSVRFSSRPEDEAACRHIIEMDRHLAAAFLFPNIR